MKAQLQALQREDPKKVFIARRINKLGFQSAETLREHFSSYGEVLSIHVSHSRVKFLRPVGDRRVAQARWRLRAAALGFVVMASPDATAKILAEGPEHCVNGVNVLIQPFQRRSGRELEDEMKEEHAEDCDEKYDSKGENHASMAQAHGRSSSPDSDTMTPASGSMGRFVSDESEDVMGGGGHEAADSSLSA